MLDYPEPLLPALLSIAPVLDSAQETVSPAHSPVLSFLLQFQSNQAFTPDDQDKDSREPQSLSAPPKAKMTAAPLPTATAAKESETTNHENSSSGRREENWADEIVLLLAGKMQDQQDSFDLIPPLMGTEQDPFSFSHQQEHAKSAATGDAEGQLCLECSPSYRNQAGSGISGMESSHYHTTYPSYHHQDSYSQHYQSSDQQQHNYPGEMATENTHDSTSSRVGAEVVVPFPLEGNRKPFAITGMGDKPLKGILKKESGYQNQLDFEPIPLNEMAFIPRLSSSEADMFHSPAHPLIADTDPASHSFEVAPQVLEVQINAVLSPQSNNPATQKQRKKADRRGSSNTTSSTEGEGWERRYHELIEFKRRNNHCEVPQNYPKNPSLGTWVNKQRMEHKNREEGKNSSLTDNRLERLESIGFRWAKRKGQASWDEKFNELVAYKAKFGNCLVPTKYKNNTALGRWVSTQRSEYKKYQEGKTKTAMNLDKIRRLESIGFAWFMAL